MHRYHAALKLDWDSIDCVYVDLSDLDRELWEIDENLMRAELTELERGQHLERRKEIFDAKTAAENIPTSLSDGRAAGPQHQKKFDADTADKTGMEKSTVRKARKRAVKIAPEVQEQIKDMPNADVGVELDALAQLVRGDESVRKEKIAAVFRAEP